MNRLTQHIRLVLISSSLVLAGCDPYPPDDDQRPDDANQNRLAGGNTCGHAGYAPGYGAGYHSAMHGGATGLHTPSGTSSGFHSSGIHSSGGIGGSARGGFGASAHGGGS